MGAARATAVAGEELELAILGPLEVRRAGAVLPLPGLRPRALLAVLVVNANRVLSAERLIDELWGDGPPPSARSALQVHVATLRRALGAGHNLATVAGGYVLHLSPDRVDAAVFEQAVETAHRLIATDPARAAAVLRDALRLWRGEPLGELPDLPSAQVEAARLEELRLTALERRAEADLACGRHAEVVGELVGLVSRHPDRERLRAQLMLALYRSGRQADALAEYRRFRAYLSDQLGLEPAGELRRLEREILDQAPALDPPPGARGSGAARVQEEPAHAGPEPAPPSSLPLPEVTPRNREGSFVGREDALGHLRARWEDARTALVLLVGEAGVGKTRLATQFAEEVHRVEGAVLYGRCDAEALLGYQPFAEALDHLLAHAGPGFAAALQPELETLAWLLPNIRRHAPAPTGDGSQQTLRFQAFEAVVAVLGHAAERQPLLLVLDDLHWADRPTLLLLRHVLRRGSAARLLVLGTFRTVEGQRHQPLVELLADVRRERRFDRLDLPGLDPQDTRALVRDRLGADVTPDFVERLHEQTGGNAFFIEETARALADAGVPLGDALGDDALEGLGVPAGVSEVMVRRLGQLSGTARELLTAASVVGRSFELGLLEHLVDASPDALVLAVEDAVGAGLVVEDERLGVFGFAHALVREVLYAQLTATRKVRLHLKVARVLEERFERGLAGPAELAHHFELARALAGPEPARRYAIAAGRKAAELFAYEEAAQHLRRALGLFGDDEAGRCETLLALGRVQWHAGDVTARATFLEAAESAERRGAPEQLARAALGLGERYFEVTYLGARYRDLLEQALGALAPADRPLRALLLARLAVNLAFPEEDARAHALAEDAVAMARRLGDPKLLAAVLLARHVTLLDVRHLDRRLALGEELRTLAGGHQELAAEACHWRMYDLLGVGDLHAAERERAQLERLADRLGQPVLRSLAAGARGLWAELAGDAALAERCAEESLRQARIAQTGDADSSWASQVFALRRRQGRLGELRQVVERLAASGGHRLGWASALGVLRLETGDREGARAVYEQEMGDGPGALARGMFRLTRLSLLSELCAGLGDRDGARALHALLAPHAGRNVVVAYCSFWGPVDASLALLARTLGDEALARRHARAALERTRAMPAPALLEELEGRYARWFGEPALLTSDVR